MPILNSHGSGCCGARCIQGFSTVTVDQKRQLDNCIEAEKRRRPKGFVELIITDTQALRWHEELVSRGFERIIRFYNSGNSMCNVYVLINGQENLVGKSDDPVSKIENTKVKTKEEVISSPFSKQTENSVTTRQGRATTPAINASPRATRIANERGINLVNVRGTGPNGRILVRDVPNA